VWGVIYDMDPADLIALDGYEGYNPHRACELNNYNRKRVRILRDGENLVECLTYVATLQPGEFFPSVHYHGLIHSGAIENAIPDEYVQRLEQIPTLTL
jgi:hypothetical protein